MATFDATLAKNLATTLEEVLDAEFDALKSSDMQSFEKIQKEKELIIQDLNQLDLPAKLETTGAHPNLALDQTLEILLHCKQKFQRNELLVQKKLESVKSALHVLKTGSSQQPLELYTKLGTLKSQKSR